MKALAFILSIALSTSIVSAQKLELKLEKTTDKYGLKKKASPNALIMNSPNHLNFKARSYSLNQRLDSSLSNRRTSPRTHAEKWYVIPDTNKVARIPNALPYFTVPEVAAIPNPLLRHKKDIFNSGPLN
ncbi:MAG TPA: hypothetical protein VM935_17445 [Chitinophagaceae bacterium]|jgi:hypothetical protein|nr:hypothetical protein [Chitinophagaceae bacterium]